MRDSYFFLHSELMKASSMRESMMNAVQATNQTSFERMYDTFGRELPTSALRANRVSIVLIPKTEREAKNCTLTTVRSLIIGSNFDFPSDAMAKIVEIISGGSV